MKSSYELAMERLNKASPSVRLTPEKKKELAELDSKYAAKIAERELSIKDDIDKANGAGEFEKAEQLQKQLVQERKSLQSELEEKKDKVRTPRA